MAPQVPSPVVALNLGLALVSTSNAPLLLLDSTLTIIAASKSFCRAFEIDPTKANGCLLSELGAGEWNKPQLISMLSATASGYVEIACCVHRGPRSPALSLARPGLRSAPRIPTSLLDQQRSGQ